MIVHCHLLSLTLFTEMSERLAREVRSCRDSSVQTNCSFPRNSCESPRYASSGMHRLVTHLLRIDMAPSKIPNAARGTIKGASTQNLVTFSIRSAPVPGIILQFLLHNLTTLRALQRDGQTSRDTSSNSIDIVSESELVGVQGDVLHTPSVRADQFWNALEEKCNEAGGEWVDICDKIWSFGPHHAGGCILIDYRKDMTPLSCVALWFLAVSLMLYSG